MWPESLEGLQILNTLCGLIAQDISEQVLGRNASEGETASSPGAGVIPPSGVNLFFKLNRAVSCVQMRGA